MDGGAEVDVEGEDNSAVKVGLDGGAEVEVEGEANDF